MPGNGSGFIRPGYDPLKTPDAPTSASASGGDASASVSFTAPSNVGGSAITAYYAVSNPGQVTATAASSPVSVTGLTNGTAYTFQVWALNSYGPGAWSGASGSVTPAAPTAVFGTGFVGGWGGYQMGTIQQLNMSSAGNAYVFGSLTVSRANVGACGNSIRAIFASGGAPTSGNVIDYVTYASLGSAQDFGDLLNTNFSAAASNSVTGIVLSGGSVSQSVTLASTGNSVSFGGSIPVYAPPDYGQCALASPTRAVFGGGNSTSYYRQIYYTTIATTGTWSFFGNLSVGGRYPATGGNATRGLFLGGENPSSGVTNNIIEYITIASTGSAIGFGDLTQTVSSSAGTSSATRTFRMAGNGGGLTNVIDYVVTATTGNATDFGDASYNSYMSRGTSNAHGGLQ